MKYLVKIIDFEVESGEVAEYPKQFYVNDLDLAMDETHIATELEADVRFIHEDYYTAPVVWVSYEVYFNGKRIYKFEGDV